MPLLDVNYECFSKTRGGHVQRTLTTGTPEVQSMRHGEKQFPPFTAMLLLVVVCIKPLSDAFYDFSIVKYGYMALLGFAWIFAKSGEALNASRPYARDSEPSLAWLLWLCIAYFLYLILLTVSYGGSLQEVFKIVSPFVFFLFVGSAHLRGLPEALLIGSVLTIGVNAALLPFDFGWVRWGTVNTFKGYYYFKTDLAYALTFSVLICAVYLRFRLNIFLIAAVLLASTQVLLSNSRLNYLTFVMVVVFIVIKSGLNIRSVLRYGLMIAAMILVVTIAYDPTRLLGFDTSSEGAFTQGRNVIWARILNSMAANSPLEWLVGRGLFADLALSAATFTAESEVHNAHNQYLHLVYNQGIVGTALYLSLWILLARNSMPTRAPDWLRGTGLVAAGLLALQGMTAVVSSFATKTWPLVMVFLVLRSVASQSGKEGDDLR